MAHHTRRFVPSALTLGVFCGSQDGNSDDIRGLASHLGSSLAKAGIDLVYGGSRIGIMGILADSVLEAGGRAIGVIPVNLFNSEVPHTSLTERIEVTDMHERKRIMYERSDLFCALPGGYGTLEEVFEAATWTQLGLHDKPKPVVLLDDQPKNKIGFWTGLDEFLDRIALGGFIKIENRSLVRRVDSVAEVITLAQSTR